MAESSRRKLLHTRQVSCRGYQLDDGRWEIEGQMELLGPIATTAFQTLWHSEGGDM
jgi:hypothetical protein